MNVKKGDVAIIVSGVEANIGKLVYVVDDISPEIVTSLGCRGFPKWYVWMVSGLLKDEAGEDVVGGLTSEESLCRLDMPPEQAEAMRMDGYKILFEMVFAELEADEEDTDLIVASLIAAEEDEVASTAMERPCYFVRRGFDRSTVKEDALFCEIPLREANRLQKAGYREPIHFDAMAGKYWVCGTDGGVASTSEIVYALRCGCEKRISDGPFDTEDAADSRLTVSKKA